MALVHGLRRDFSPKTIKAKDFKLLPLGMLMAMGVVILMPNWIGAISPSRSPRTQAGR